MNYKSSLAPILAAVVQIHPVCLLAASYRSESNPIGEKAYAAHSLSHLLPLAIIVCAFLLAWLVAGIRGKARRLAADHDEPHHG